MAAASGDVPVSVVTGDDCRSNNAAALMPRIMRMVAETKELLSVTADEAQLLLSHCAWDRERLQQRYFDDSDALRLAAGVGAGPCPPPLPAGASAASTFMDATTLEDVAYGAADACACGHWFPKESWARYLEMQVAESFTSVSSTRCPGDRCRLLVPPRLFKAHLPPDALARWRQATVKAFVKADRHTSWCPTPDCPFSVTTAGGGARDVECGAGHEFCSRCGHASPHAPASCAELATFLRDEKKDDASEIWILANCMPCPKCKAMVYRDGGCNHSEWPALDPPHKPHSGVDPARSHNFLRRRLPPLPAQ
jgi:ariadne-1